jgi:hypothetical protein
MLPSGQCTPSCHDPAHVGLPVMSVTLENEPTSESELMAASDDIGELGGRSGGCAGGAAGTLPVQQSRKTLPHAVCDGQQSPSSCCDAQAGCALQAAALVGAVVGVTLSTQRL